jgi:NTP pyrophosphatase (non-canonical NTP hydrolase)
MADLAELSDKAERVSQVYASRCAIDRDDDWFLLKLQEEAGELVAEYLRGTGRGRVGERSPEAIRQALEDETADLFAQLLLFARHNHIDLEAALQRKWFAWLEPKNDKTAGP